MDFSLVLSTVRLWRLEGRIKLVNTLSEEIAADPAYSGHSKHDELELVRRLEEADANPENDIPWEEVRAQAKARWKK